MPPVRVTTAAAAAAADAAAIAGGTPSRALMQRAGAAAAGEIVRRYPHLLGAGVAVHAGPGNNGGDAWVIARALRRYGVRVGVRQWGAEAPATEDARFEAERARADGAAGSLTGAERLIVDGVLGTGARPPARDYALEYARGLADARRDGRVVVALDVPTGLDATTGEVIGAAVAADLTLTFGTLKRGLLLRRDLAGEVAVLDIGLPGGAAADALGASLYDARDGAGDDDALGALFRIAPDAHKGDRGKVAVVGGAPGMAGAALLASDAALRSGAGMVRTVVAPESVAAVQTALPAAMAAPWPADDEALARSVVDWADAVLVGPGLGRSPEAGALLDRLLAAWRGPVVLDADALNHFAGRPDALAAALAGRTALLTPHPLEFARLASLDVDDVLARRFDAGREFAQRVGATVLLKGVPTVVSDGEATLVTATGTPALATAGSGDVLGGIAAALLGVVRSPHGGGPAPSALRHAAAAAWVHGRAGEVATARRGGVRGTTLADVLDALADAWPRAGGAGASVRRAPYPVLAELPAVPG